VYGVTKQCENCERQNFANITIDLFSAHIEGKDARCRDVLGSYPLNEEGYCTFIVADFDDKHRGDREDPSDAAAGCRSARATATAFFKACTGFNIPVHIEVSRSRRGLHLWLFFSDEVSAQQARRLFSLVLTEAMDRFPDFDMDTYDMFIPRQDFPLKRGSIGNTVALPLQGRAREKRGSVFVDEDMKVYKDQWEYLSRVKKLSALEVEGIIKSITTGAELGTLVPNEDEDGLGKPWERKKSQAPLLWTDFTESIEITRANMLHITKQQLSPRALNKIRRLASFKNPKFYELQRMRLSVWGTPRVISAYEETNDYLSIPRGAEEEVLGLLELAGAEYTIEDLTTKGIALEVEFTGNLRDEQPDAADALLKYDNGVLYAPPGFGKTVITTHLNTELSCKALRDSTLSEGSVICYQLFEGNRLPQR